tara:strand:- start:28706 stop:28888 length:183 start_codon:yes stop_codon:yes gene_type:complete
VRRAGICGGCIAACGSARMREDFVDAVGLNQITRFQLDPRDLPLSAQVACLRRRMVAAAG